MIRIAKRTFGQGRFDKINRLIASLLALLAIALPSSLPVFAQESEQEKAATLRQELMGDLTKRSTMAVPLDRPINPETYRLGPGDELTIFIWGNIQAQYGLTITPEGKLLLPTIGPLDISGLMLSEAKTYIEQRILERYRNVKVTTDLTGLRNFRVYIGGAIKIPGVYMANGVTRVSEIINLAGGFASEDQTNSRWQRNPDSDDLPAGVASHRNIILKHIQGAVDTVDILRFEITGDLRFDFKVSDGDQIFVPLKERSINLYGIFGGVKNPGYYEYSSRDSLKDLIELGHGLALNADSAQAELVRFNIDNKTNSTILLPLRDILLGKTSDIHLSPDDRVFIKTRSNYHEKQQVLILGEVKFPGFYAVKPESTYLTQIIQQTGGFTPLASLPEAEMTRFTSEEVKDREFERLKTMQIKDMSDVEYEYYKMKSRQKPGRVAVDFVELYSGNKTGDIKLRDGDMIMIPRISEVINVSGEVANPGLLSYNPEYNYLDYINLAGGLSFRANKSQIRLVKGVTGEWKKPGNKDKLDPGDTILIPEKEKINYLNTVKDVMVFAGNLATVYLVIKQASK